MVVMLRPHWHMVWRTTGSQGPGAVDNALRDCDLCLLVSMGCVRHSLWSLLVNWELLYVLHVSLIEVTM